MWAIEYVWRNPYVRVVVYVLLAVGLLYLLYRLKSVIWLALAGYLFAYLSNPLVEGLQKRARMPRWLGVLVVFGLLALLLVGFSFLLGSVVVQLAKFTEQLPALVQMLRQQLEGLVGRIEVLRGQSPELRDFIAQATATLSSLLSTWATSLLGFLQGEGLRLFNQTVGFLGNALQVVLVFVIGGYMLLSYPAIGQTFMQLVPKRWQETVGEFARDTDTAVGGYIRGQIVVAAGVGAIVALGLSLIGLPLALAIGLLAAVLNIIPYLGAILSITPALLLALGMGWLEVILVAAVFVLANQIEAHVLSPLVLSKSTNLHPVTVVLALLSGLALYGLVGGLLAVPLAALGKLLLHRYWIGSRFWNS